MTSTCWSLKVKEHLTYCKVEGSMEGSMGRIRIGVHSFCHERKANLSMQLVCCVYFCESSISACTVHPHMYYQIIITHTHTHINSALMLCNKLFQGHANAGINNISSFLCLCPQFIALYAWATTLNLSLLGHPGTCMSVSISFINSQEVHVSVVLERGALCLHLHLALPTFDLFN